MNRKIMHIKIADHNDLHTDVETYYDNTNNAIHVLDRYALDSGKTVTNSLEFYIRPHILEAYGLLDDKVRWLIYPTDGYISELINFEPFRGSGTFVSVSDNDQIIYKPFKKIMRDINELRGYLEYFKEETYDKIDINALDTLAYNSYEKGWIKKYKSIEQELLEIFCGIESKDVERSELAKLVREKMEEGYSKASESVKQSREKIIVAICTYIAAKFELPEMAIAYKFINYILNTFADVYYSSQKDKLCKKFQEQA